VAAGLYLGRKSSEFFSPGVRLQARGVWNAIEFILNGFVFVLIGLQLPFVLAGVSELTIGRLLVYATLFSVLLILLRLLWTFPGSYVALFIRKKLLRQNENWPSPRAVFVVGWTGMRGVLALAAAMSLPETIANGGPFPHRDLIIFLTFSVILVTLVLQGLTLPPVIRALGLAGPSGSASKEQDARRLVLEAALAYIEQNRQSDSAGAADVYDDLAKHYQHRLARASRLNEETEIDNPKHYLQYVDLSRTLLDVERRTALRLRDEGLITDEALREIEHELDLNETRLVVSSHV
jgi:CPA1 family monovalent cation:H+ antiporter